MRYSLRLSFLLLVLTALSSCSFHPDRRQNVEDDDFLEPASAEEKREVWNDIADLKGRVEQDYENVELHRQLAVRYRLAGTPHARLLSSEEIDKAITLDPENPLLHVERGLTFIARRFIGEAEASFRRALQLDPRCFEALFQLARLEEYEYFKSMCVTPRLVKAIEYYEKAYRLDRKHEETLVNLAFLHSLRQMHQTGLKYGTRAVMYHPRSARAHLACGLLYTRRKEFEKATREFSSAFLLMTEEERYPYEDISPLLPAEERGLYLSSSEVKKADWSRRFWAENDPTPATDINERQLEHFSRVLTADWSLSDERRDTRGYDTDRGAAMIRFGLPDKKLYDMGGGTTGGWIVWQYQLPRGSFNLYFNDEFLNGDYHFPISDFYGEMSLNMLNTVPPLYQYPIKFAPFPIGVEVAELRGADERTRLEFSIAIPDSLAHAKSPTWDLLISFFDNEWKRFSLDRISFKPDTLAMIEKQGGTYLVYSYSMEILPRQLTSTCILEVILDKDLRKGTRRYPIDIRDMYGQYLKLSSIKLTIPGARDSCSTTLDPIPSYRRNERLCLMYEIYNLKRDDRNDARYRLIYSIRNPDESDDASAASLRKTLAYMWSSMKGERGKEKPYIESSIEQRTQSTVVSDNLQIDIGALERGTYALYLGVEDLVSGMTAVESRIFTVSE